MPTMQVQTPRCPQCGESSLIEVDTEAFRLYQRGAFVQEAFPKWTPDQRELLITGMHPKCWDELFGEEE